MESTDFVPTLTTDRLLLRGHRITDFTAYAEMYADPAFVRFMGGDPLSEEDAWLKFLRFPGHWLWLGFGFWAIEEKHSRLFIGTVGFALHRRATDERLKAIPEIGWSLAPSAQGNGYAIEAASAVLRWGDEHLRHDRTFCITHPDNHASIRVAERCGYAQSGSITHRGISKVLFCRARLAAPQPKPAPAVVESQGKLAETVRRTAVGRPPPHFVNRG